MAVERTSRIYWLGFVAAALLPGCDSSDPEDCQPSRTDTYTQSASGIHPITLSNLAQFEMQQEIDTYPSECTAPSSDISRTRLAVRNLTTCELSFDYRLSVFVGQVGTTVLGSVSVRPQAVDDKGIVFRDVGIQIDESQVILTLSMVEQSGC